MPAYEKQLTTQAINDLVALIRSWATPPDQTKKELPDKTLKPLMNHPNGTEPDFTSKDRFVAADTVKTALDKKQKFILLDARPPSDYVTDHITGAVSVPFYGVAEYLTQLPKDVWIVTYCACPHAESGKAYDALKANGYTKIKVLNEGYRVWKQRGYPTKKGKKP
jgi:cytochrome c oxidase cbb3-type subunit 3/ubiquinol-cytochrome c reductase cytochrome c subunit